MTINLTVQVEQKTLDIIKELFCFWISFMIILHFLHLPRVTRNLFMIYVPINQIHKVFL